MLSMARFMFSNTANESISDMSVSDRRYITLPMSTGPARLEIPMSVCGFARPAIAEYVRSTLSRNCSATDGWRITVTFSSV